MANKPQGLFLSACGVQGCRESRVIGTAYCQKHSTIESRTRVSSGGAYWLFGALAAATAVWCIGNALAVSGLECSQVTFSWEHFLTGAFACVAEVPGANTGGLAFFAPHAGLNTSVVLSIAGITSSAVAAILLYRATRYDHF